MGMTKINKTPQKGYDRYTWRQTRFFGLDEKMTEEQERYIDSIFSNLLTICNSKAGTGKTTLAVGAAKLIGKPLLYLFNPTEEGKMGFRKGSQGQKEEAYLQPLKDALIAIGDNPLQVLITEESADLKYTSSMKWVEAQSHTFLRGGNIDDKTVIIDEAQNWTAHDLKKTLTRIKDNCHVIVIGHVGQIDIDKPSRSGFMRAIEHFSSKDYCNICELTKNFRGRLSTDADEL